MADERKLAVVTGGAGFTGAVLVEQLRKHGYSVCALVRPRSEHNKRINTNDTEISVFEIDMEKLLHVKDLIRSKASVFFHLAVLGGKDFESQLKNVNVTLDAIRLASELGCRRFIGIGSQAEYGVVPLDELTMEDRMPNPITPYGAAKVASCYLSRMMAEELDIEWVWGRIFSLIGKYEPQGRMFPDLCSSLNEGRAISLTSCRQNWDYLDVHDAADAIIALCEKGVSGEIYNIAHGAYRPLREYVEEARKIISPKTEIRYGNDPNPFISLQPSVQKIQNDTGWKAERTMRDSICDYCFSQY